MVFKRSETRERATLEESPVSAVKAYGVTPRGSLRGHGGDAEMGTHFVASPPSTEANHNRVTGGGTMFAVKDVCRRESAADVRFPC